MWGLLLLLLAGVWPLGGGYFIPGPAAPKPLRCKATYERGLEGADCRARNLKDVPTYLNKNVEVLELTFNRIRELYNESFIDYPYLKYLYLDDNSISYIETGALDPLQDLLVLDLSWNSLHNVPQALYNLPFLWKLNLGKNPFEKVIFSESLPSILELDLHDCRLKELPNVEVFPRLNILNVSTNQIKNIHVRQIAPLCRLSVLDLRRNSKLFARDGFCDCQMFTSWSKMRKMKIFPAVDEICGVFPKGKQEFDNSTCFNNETKLIFDESFLALQNCETQVLEYGSGPVRLRGSVLWTLGAAVAILVLVICVTSVYCAKRRTRHLPEERDRSVESLTTKSSS